MQIKDLGVISGDLLVFGGIYSNIQALNTFMSWAKAQGFERSQTICTGDIVAYGANPAEVCEIMVNSEIPTIAGNCEVQLATDQEDCGCGFEQGSVCDLASKGWFPFAAARTRKFRPYFAGLPDVITLQSYGKRYAVIHGGVRDISRFIWPNSPDTVFVEEFSVLEAQIGRIDGVICGHSGIAFERFIEGKHWVNAGVIGMPPHDGKAATRFGVLSSDGIRFRNLHYDHAAAAKAMTEAGLTQGYERSVQTGIWPSEDVLPDALRR